MQQVKVSELASEFEIKNTVVISELKKVGVWVPAADTLVDQDIADRIRRRLQLIVDLEHQEEEKVRDKQGKKKPAVPKARKSIKQLGRRSDEVVKGADEKIPTPLMDSMKPRKGKASYRKVELPEEEAPLKVSVTIEDEPIIKKVEAQISSEALEKAMVGSTQAELDKLTTIQEAEKKFQPKPPVAPKEPEESEISAEAPKETVEMSEEVGQEDEVVEEVSKVEESPVAEVEEDTEELEIREMIFAERVTVKELADKLQIKSNEIIKQLLDYGLMVTVNQTLDRTIVDKVCEAHGVIANLVSFEQATVVEEEADEAAEDLKEREPVVTVMGHVDHGKTSLLDAIRETRVASGEAGGITQHIGAYHVEANDQKIVFIDTPGHEAFTRMRARGAQVTDIVVLVVAADDGVMPQTKEAIDHAQAAGVPMVVAINKTDKTEAQPQRVKQELSDLGLIAEDWGGDTVMVEVSAKEKTNLDSLLEMILLTAEILELKANPSRLASGIVLEARLDKGRGVVATVLVRSGMLRVGHSFIAGAAYGKVRAMFDDRGNAVTESICTSAVEILGFQSIPQAGDTMQVVDDATRAREIGEYRQQELKEKGLTQGSKVSLDDLYAQMESGELKELRMILKADAQGSVEVLVETLEKLSTDKVCVKVIHSGVGAISESDVLLASASDAIVVGFNIRPERTAQDLIEHEQVDMRLYTVIYDATEEIKQAMVGLLEPTIKEKDVGRFEVRDTFRVPKFGTIAGGYVQDGLVRRKAYVRLLRDNVVVYEGEIDSLRRFKEDVNEVKGGYECGLSIANFNDVKVGDVVQVYDREEVIPEL
ncbi:MAG: translation initiation factor IF-2 [Acidobacteriota bacterium]|nr:translation initiation factor IF-2 [Acidobacteriota bacterium]